MLENSHSIEIILRITRKYNNKLHSKPSGLFANILSQFTKAMLQNQFSFSYVIQSSLLKTVLI